MESHINSIPRSFWIYKKAIDLFFAVSLLPGLMLCVIILAVLNPIYNPGSIFFRQQRVGLNGKVFTIFKFRTVVNPGTENQLTNDQRSKLTGLGAFMRSTRVDEVPQILNVLLGHMSMIGPRPEQVQLYKIYANAMPNFYLRQKTKPGITGLAQLRFGYTSDAEGAGKKLRWDLVYLQSLGFRTETHLVLRTFTFVMKGLGRVFLRNPFKRTTKTGSKIAPRGLASKQD